MKTFIKTLIIALSAIGMTFGSAAIAAELNGFSNDLDVLHVTTTRSSNSSWSKNATVNDGDTVSFNIYYHVTSDEDADNVRARISNLTSGTYTGSTSVTGQVSADNTSSVNGSVNITTTEEMEFSLYKVLWQPNKCNQVSCSQQVLNNPSNVLSSGALIGTIPGVAGLDSSNNFQYQGNVVVEFKASAVNDDPVFVAPTVDTDSATNVDEDSATLNGEVDFRNTISGYAGSTFFQWGTSVSSLNNTTQAVPQTNDTNFSANISGLADDTVYYFRAVAVDGTEYYGPVRSFKTDDEDDDTPTSNGDEPTVETRQVSNIDETAATVFGRFDLNETDEVDFWFEYGTDSDLDEFDRTDKEDYDSNRTIDERINNLEEDTRYYYRAVIEDLDEGIIYYGDIEDFRTDESDNNDVEAETKTADDIRDDSAELRGYADIDDSNDALYYFEWGTSSVSLPNKTTERFIRDSGDVEFELEDLRSCTTYYFRLVVEDEDSNNDDKGIVRSFTTDGDNCDSSVSSDPEVFTNTATGVTTNSATFRSIVGGEGTGTCYFEFGRTTALGSVTSAQSVNLDSTNACSSTRAGLVSNSTYYYRAVLVNDGVTERGLTRTLRTLSTPVVVTPRPPVVVTPSTPSTPTPVDNTVTVTVVEEVTNTGGPIRLTKFVSSFDDPRFGRETEADRNEAVFYKVVIENNSTDVIEDITVVDFIPFYLELDGQQSLDDDSDKEVRWRITRLQPGDTREFTTEMRVRDDARYGDDIDSFASAFNDDFSVNSNDVVIEVEEDEEVITDNTDGSQAASIFGAGFFPTTLFGWLVLLAIVLAIAYLISRILFSRNENERVLAELRAMQNNQ